MKENPLISQLRKLKAPFQPARRFWITLLLETAFLAAVTLIVYSWATILKSTFTEITGVNQQIAALGGMTSLYAAQIRDRAAATMSLQFLIYTSIGIVLLLFAWAFLKSLTYNYLNKSKLSWSAYWRFLVMLLPFALVSFIIFNILQYIVFRISYGTFDTSFLTRAGDAAGLVIAALIIFYLNIAYFSPLSRTARLGKSFIVLWRTFIKKFHRFLLPLLWALILFILLNIVVYPIMKITVGSPFLIVAGIIYLLYIVWARIYFTDLAISLAEQDKAERKEKQAKTAPKKKGARPAKKKTA